MDPTHLLLALLLVVAIAQVALIIALKQRVDRLHIEVRHQVAETVEEVRGLARLLPTRGAWDSHAPGNLRTTVPAALAAVPAQPQPMPLESETPPERRFATAPKSVVKAAIEFSNSAFDAFAKPPPAFADTQAIDPDEVPPPLARKPVPTRRT
jgi:hypothetical protein